MPGWVGRLVQEGSLPARSRRIVPPGGLVPPPKSLHGAQGRTRAGAAGHGDGSGAALGAGEEALGVTSGVPSWYREQDVLGAGQVEEEVSPMVQDGEGEDGGSRGRVGSMFARRSPRTGDSLAAAREIRSKMLRPAASRSPAARGRGRGSRGRGRGRAGRSSASPAGRTGNRARAGNDLADRRAQAVRRARAMLEEVERAAREGRARPSPELLSQLRAVIEHAAQRSAEGKGKGKD